MQFSVEQTLVDSVEVDKIVFPERFSERISEQSEVLEVTEISTLDWNLQRTVKLISQISERFANREGYVFISLLLSETVFRRLGSFSTLMSFFACELRGDVELL